MEVDAMEDVLDDGVDDDREEDRVLEAKDLSRQNR